jgi:hypothetical protein
MSTPLHHCGAIVLLIVSNRRAIRYEQRTQVPPIVLAVERSSWTAFVNPLYSWVGNPRASALATSAPRPSQDQSSGVDAPRQDAEYPPQQVDQPREMTMTGGARHPSLTNKGVDEILARELRATLVIEVVRQGYWPGISPR